MAWAQLLGYDGKRENSIQDGTNIETKRVTE